MNSSASQRAALGRAEPASSTGTAPAMGSQISRLSK